MSKSLLGGQEGQIPDPDTILAPTSWTIFLLLLVLLLVLLVLLLLLLSFSVALTLIRIFCFGRFSVFVIAFAALAGRLLIFALFQLFPFRLS